MFKRVLFGLVFLASIAWIGYIGFEIFTATKDYSEARVFNSNDGQLLIVSRPNEIHFNAISAFETSPTFDLAQNLNSKAYSSGFFSFKRAHFILVSASKWDEKSLKSVFNSVELTIDPAKKTFTIGKWSGKYKNDRLYASQMVFEPNDNPSEAFIYDKKASASILHFDKNSSVSSVLDVYFKSDGKVDYITRNAKIKQGNQVRDEQLFASFISKKIQNYHFYERDYYGTLDTEFVDGPMFKWLQSGFVEIDYAGEKVLISDHIDGQDPILILNDIQQTIDAASFKTPLTSSFPKVGKAYFVKYLGELVVISHKEVICDQLIADYKLGNTISQNRHMRKWIYADLPQAVSERHIEGELRLSKAVYKGYLLETKYGKAMEKETKSDESMAMPCNFEIIDFQVFGKPGNLIALGSKGEIACFNEGKLAWKTTLESAAIGKLQLIELHGGGETHILVNSEDEIYVWKLNGDAAPGFPIKLDNPAQNEVKFYRWKEKSYFLVANKKTVLQFDSEGRELTAFKSKLAITRKIDVWSSQGRLFFGFANNSNFDMFEVAKNKSLRVFAIPPGSQPLKAPNELIHYGFDGTQFSRYDQKGTKTGFEKYLNGLLLPSTLESKNPTLIIQDKNTLHFINQKGIEFGKIRLPFNEIEGVEYFTLESGKTVVAVIDGLENNVHLYNMTGTKQTNQSLEGKTKVSVSSYGKGLLITTVVDNFVIHYFEN